jgi:hypothetical protein
MKQFGEAPYRLLWRIRRVREAAPGYRLRTGWEWKCDGFGDRSYTSEIELRAQRVTSTVTSCGGGEREVIWDVAEERSGL